MASHEFEISVSDFDAAGKDYRFPVRAAWLRGVLEGTDIRSGMSDGEVEVRLSKSGADVVVHGTVRAELVTSCARCLADARVHVEGALSVLMVPAKKIAKAAPKSETKSEAASGEKSAEKKGKRKRRDAEEEEFVFSSDEADVAPYDGDTVVLDDVVKDEILLEIPMIPLCSEDCPGMSPSAVEASSSTTKKEADEAQRIDPRLMPLLELMKERKD